MYPPPPPQEWKSWIQVKVTFCFWPMYPPQEWKSWIQVKVTFCFWLMYPPPGMKKLDTGQSDILLLADVPPPHIEIGLNMNAIGKKSFQERSSSTFYQSTPPPPFHYHYLILCLNRKLVNFNFKWVYGPEPHPPALSSQKNKTHFWITFNFWWLAGLVNGLEPHPPPLSSQKNKMLIFGLRSTSDDQLGWLMDSNPICHPSPAKKIKMLIFGLRSTSDDRLGWSMDLNPVHHLSPAKKIKCLFLDYIQLLMIGRAGWWTWTPSAIPLQPKKIKCSFLDYIQLLMISQTIRAKNVDQNAKKWKRPPKSSKNKMFIFGLRSTSDDRPSDLSIKHWPKRKKMKKAPLSHQKIKCYFWIMFNFWWSAEKSGQKMLTKT